MIRKTSPKQFAELVYNRIASGDRIEGLEKLFPGIRDSVINAALDGIKLTGDGTAAWTDERISDLYKTYGVSESSSHTDYAKAYASHISPDDFLSLTATEADRADIEMDTVEKYGRLDEKGLRDTKETPYLYVDFDTGVVESHEGRHRMALLANEGVDSVPVVVIPYRQTNAEKYNTELIPSLELTGQEWSFGKAAGKVRLNDVTPFSNRYRDKIKEDFGGDGQVRFSTRITPQQDAEYMTAVESGDTKTAQRMVDEAAKKAGYTVKAWHIGGKGIKVFQAGNSAGLIYFADSGAKAGKAARSRAQEYAAYLKIGNPVNTKQTAIPWYEAENSLRVAEWRRKDHDAVYVEDEAGVSTAVFSPEQIKSADPVTYDDDGNVIPLSDRFKPEKEDIRFSMRLPVEEVTDEDIEAVQSIGRKSVNDFTSEDIRKTEAFARRYWRELGTKSPFFRAWFGDWRANDQTAVQIATEQGNARGLQHNEDTGWDINVSGKVFNETRSHNAAVNKAAIPYLEYIDDIVNKAVLLDSFTMSKTKSPNSLLMHSLYAVADIGNGSELLKLYVEEMADPNSRDTAKRAYQLQNIEKAFPAGVRVWGQALSSVTNTGNAIDTVSDLFEAVKALDKSFRPKPASKVVNEDGRPLAVYHGTDADFTVFDMTKGRSTMDIQGSFFSPWEMDAGGYGSKIGKYYLNIKNPAPEGTAYKALNRFKGQNNAGVKAREYLERLGYDGVDNGGEEYIAFRPEQIKSADGNVGTFDKNNPDTRFSTRLTPEEQLVRQNDELKKRVEYWRGQTKRTKTPRPVKTKKARCKMPEPVIVRPRENKKARCKMPEPVIVRPRQGPRRSVFLS
ncbi:MAG: hypothetical protein J5449_03800 [Oscillospiraceae bacterium]|nr:hypothetical protein [Oscillospiraceae bacterium]